MALDPLLFKAEINGNALSTLDEIQKKLNSINGASIKIDVADTASLKSLIETLSKAPSIKLGDGLSKEVQELEAQLTKAKSTLADLRRQYSELGQQSTTNVETTTKAIQEQEEAVKRLQKAYWNAQDLNLGRINDLDNVLRVMPKETPYDTLRKRLEKYRAVLAQYKSQWQQLTEGMDGKQQQMLSGDGIKKTFDEINKYLSSGKTNVLKELRSLVSGETSYNAFNTRGGSLSKMKDELNIVCQKIGELDHTTPESSNMVKRIEAARAALVEFKKQYEDAISIIQRYNKTSEQASRQAEAELGGTSRAQLEAKKAALEKEQDDAALAVKEKLIAAEQKLADLRAGKGTTADESGDKQLSIAEKRQAITEQIQQAEERIAQLQEKQAERRTAYEAEKERLLNSKGELNPAEQEYLQMEKAFDAIGATLKRKQTEYSHDLQKIEDRFSAFSGLFSNQQTWPEAPKKDELNAYINKMYDDLQRGNITAIENNFEAIQKALANLKKESSNTDIQGNPNPLIASLEKLKKEYSEVLSMTESLRKANEEAEFRFFKADNSPAYQKWQSMKDRPKEEYEEMIALEDKLGNLKHQRFELEQQERQQTKDTQKKENLEGRIAEQEKIVSQTEQRIQELSNKQGTQVTQDSFKGLAENITAIKEAIKDDNFTAFSENVNKAVLALNSLAEAFKNLSSYIGEEPVKDLVSGIGQQMTNLANQQQQMQTLGGKGKGGKGNGPTQAQLDKSIQDALYNINKLDILINQARASWNAGANGNDGFNPALKSAIDRVEELRNGLENIVSGGGKNASGQTTRIMTGTAEYRIAVEQLKALNSAQNTAISNAIKEEASINAAAVAYERYGVMKKRAEEARDNGLVSGDDVTKVEAYIAHLDKVRALMQEIQKNGAVPQSQLAKELGLDAGMDTWTTIKQIGVQKDMIWGKANLGDMTKDLQLSKHNMKEAESEANKLTVTISNLTAKSEEYKRQGKDTGSLDTLIQKLKDYQAVFTEISEKNNASAKGIKLSEDYLQAKRSIKDVGAAEKEQQRIETNQRKYNDALQRSIDLLDRLKQASVTGDVLGLDTTKTDQAAQSIQDVISKLQAFNSQDMGNNHAVSELLATYTGVKTELSAVAREQEKLNEARRQSLDAQQQKELDDWTKSMNEAKIEASKLYVKVQKLREIRQEASEAGVNTSSIDRHIHNLGIFWDKFQDIASGTKGIGTAHELKQSADYQQELTLATESGRKTSKETTKAKHDQAEAERQLQREMRKTTSAAHEQHGAMSKIKQLTGQILSVTFAKRFVTEMMKITGELELQQRSLEVIIGNASKAAELYTNIRDLSQQSPYSFQDLLKSERQLAAFGIQTKDLYGTMKALSDIGAGLSVDVQRLILAYGHTRSYGYLSGIQNRQFETAGIDLIGELTKFYNKQAAEIRKSGGAAKNTSRMELFTRMRKRDISFEDVEQVILALDKPGGKFFNMQEKQFDTLGGKLRNLKNNYKIMMSEMGESSKGMLMGIVNMLNTLTGEWQKYANVLKLILVPLGSIKILMMALNTPMKAFTGMHAALKKSQKGWNSLGITIHNVGRSLKGFFKSLGAFLTGPQAAIFALIAALTALWNQARKTNQQIKELTTNMTEHGAADRKNIAEVMETYGNGFVNQSVDYRRTVTKDGVQIIKYKFELDDEELMKADLTGALADMKEKLQAMSPFYDRDLVNINKLTTQYDQFEALYKKMESLRYASNLKEAYGVAFGSADDDSNGWNATSDTFIEDARDFQKTLRKSFEEIDKLTETELTFYDAVLQGGLTKIKNTLNHADLKESLKYFIYQLEKSYDEAAIAAGGDKMFKIGAANAVSNTDVDRYGWQSYAPQDVIESLPGRDGGGRSFYELVDKFVKPNVLGRSLSSQRKELHRGVAPIVGVINDILQNYQEGEEEYAADAVAAVMQELIATMGVTMPEAVSTIYDIVLDELKKKYPNIDFGAFFNEQKIITLVNQELNGLIRTNTTREEVFGRNVEDENGVIKHIDGIIDKVREHIKEKAKVLGIDLATLSQDVIGDAVESAFKDVQLNYDWQKRLIGPGGLIQVNSSLQSQLKGISDVSEAADAMQKEFDDLMKNLDNYEGAAGGALKEFFGMTFKPAKITDDIKKDNKTLEAAIRQRIALLENLVAGAEKLIKEKGNSEEADRLRNILTNEIQPALDQNKSILEILRASADMKWSIKSGGSYHDEEAKRWDERIRIMKEAYDWYDKWEKKVGKDEAIKKVNNRYQDVFEEWRHDDVLPFNFDTGKIEDYMSYVEEIRDKALAKYQRQKNNEDQNKGQEALRVYRQAVAVLEEGSWDNFVRAAEKFQSIMEKTMDDLQRRWSLFTDIRDKTGNVGLAATLSGVDTSFRTQADAMRAAVQNAYAEAGGEGEVNFDISLDKDAIRSMFEGAIRGDKTDTKYMESIDGLIKGFEEWQKSEEEQEKMDINVTVDLVSNAVDVQSEVLRITSDYNRQYNALNRLFPNGGPEFDKANSILAANTNAKIVQAQQSYKFLMDGVTTMNIKAAKQIKKDYEDALLKQLKSGAITAKQYADEIQNINDKMRELENAPSYFRSFTQNGLQGVFENMQQRGKGDIEQGGAQLQEAKRLYQLADELLDKYEGTGNAAGMRQAADMFQNAKAAEAIGKNMIASGSAKMKGGGGALQTLATIDAIINGINKMVQSLKSFADYIKQVNVALGKADADEWSNSDNFLYAFSNASQQAANGWNSLKEGDIIGALQGTYGSWAEWWKSYAEGEDKTREYQIKLSERQLKVLSNMASRLDKINEKTLGYGGEVDQTTWDTFNSALDNWTKAQNGETYYTGTTFNKSAWGALGSILLPFLGGRIAENIYDKQNTKQYSSPYSDATVAAIESALQTGSLYAAQYAAKMMERDELESQLKQLEAENKKDDARIEETKQKLWDVKQDLAYWTEDLAKELWGIDIKGWADQISSALTNAFANGENAAKAFDDTVRSIMQNVVNEIIKVGLIEPMMDDLRKTLFGTKNEKGEYEGGAITTEMIRENPKQAGIIAAAAINQWRKDRGDNMILGTQEVWTGINTGLGGFLTNPNANTLSASVQGTTEETSDLLAGYVSALRQDVAAERILREQFIAEIWPTFVEETMGAVIQPLNQINTNVAAIRQSMTGQGELISAIDDIYAILNAITIGSKEVHMA